MFLVAMVMSPVSMIGLSHDKTKSK